MYLFILFTLITSNFVFCLNKNGSYWRAFRGTTPGDTLVDTPENAFRWVNSTVEDGTVPANAVEGGVDVDGATIYVGRAYHEQGDLLPAEIIPSKNAAFVTLGGQKLQVQKYQVLCEKQLKWIQSSNGSYPVGAVRGGHSDTGETLFICRVSDKGTQTVGKIHPSLEYCYIPGDNKEMFYSNYEALVLD